MTVRRAVRPSLGAVETPIFALAGLANAALVVAIFAYELLFNFLPDTLRLAAAGGITLAMFGLAASTFFRGLELWRLAVLGIAAALAMLWVMGAGISGGEADLVEGTRTLLPIIGGIWFVTYRDTISRPLVLGLVAATLVTAAVWAAVHPLVYIGGRLRIEPFTGGEDNTAHASAYMVAISLMILHILRRSGEVGRLPAWVLGGLGLGLLAGFQVATPAVMLLAYLMVHVMTTRRYGALAKAGMWIVILAGLFAVIVVHEYESFDEGRAAYRDVDDLGSGRLGVWEERLTLIADREGAAFWLGAGPGSDRFYSENWRWEKKDSHHDLLTITIESGVLGLALTGLAFIVIIRRFRPQSYPLMAFLLAGALVSNALLQRPIIALLYWLGFALSIPLGGYERASRGG